LELQALTNIIRRQEASRLSQSIKTNKFEQYQTRPVAFAREVLGIEPWSKQVEILNSIRKYNFTNVRSGHGSGKTTTAAMATLWFLQCFPGSVVITTAPSGRQVRDLLWRSIRKLFEKSKVELIGRCMTTMLECGHDWYATGFSTDEPVNFQGPHSPKGVLFIGDEASGLAEWVFDTARGFMTQENAKMLLIGNPNFAYGYFYESFQSSMWNSIHISAFDVPEHVLKPIWKEEMLGEFGEDSPIYQIRVMGEFPFQSENSIFDMKWLERAMDPMQTLFVKSTLPVEIGVDVARYGTNESVAYVRAGERVVDWKAWSGKDTMETAGRVIDLAKKWRPTKIKIDAIGIGTGPLDRIKEQGFNVIGFNSNHSPRNPEHYLNMRAEQYSNLAARFKSGEIAIPKDKKLLGQLLSMTYQYNSRGQRRLPEKEEWKRQGKKSPDRADALMICFSDPRAGYVARSLAASRSHREILDAQPTAATRSESAIAAPERRRGPRVWPVRRQ
jgi:phage terminase large subunit